MPTYTIKSGDTLTKIAREQNTSVETLADLNGLGNPDRLVVGQSILLPQTPTRYVVRPGDTLSRIAQKFGLLLPDLLRANPEIKNPNVIHIGQILSLPYGQWGTIKVFGYAYPNLRDTTVSHALPLLSALNIFTYRVTAEGGLTEPNDEEMIARTKAAGVKPRMVIANLDDGGFKGEMLRKLLESGARQELFLFTLVKTMREKGYKGLDVDFEYVPKDLKDEYNGFLARARAWMHLFGFDLSAAVAPKTRDDETGSLVEGIDYTTLGRYCDYVFLMTYEWGYSGGEAMAVAPYPEVRRVVEYAVEKISPQKIILGIPNYGYDWTLPFVAGSRAKVVFNANAPAIAADHYAPIQYDEQARSPYIRYAQDGVEHEVWFEDPRSIDEKLKLVHEFELGGVGYWTVNNPFAANWNLLAQRFKVSR